MQYTAEAGNTLHSTAVFNSAVLRQVMTLGIMHSVPGSVEWEGNRAPGGTHRCPTLCGSPKANTMSGLSFAIYFGAVFCPYLSPGSNRKPPAGNFSLKVVYMGHRRC